MEPPSKKNEYHDDVWELLRDHVASEEDEPEPAKAVTEPPVALLESGSQPSEGEAVAPEPPNPALDIPLERSLWERLHLWAHRLPRGGVRRLGYVLLQVLLLSGLWISVPDNAWLLLNGSLKSAVDLWYWASLLLFVGVSFLVGVSLVEWYVSLSLIAARNHDRLRDDNNLILEAIYLWREEFDRLAAQWDLPTQFRTVQKRRRRQQKRLLRGIRYYLKLLPGQYRSDDLREFLATAKDRMQPPGARRRRGSQGQQPRRSPLFRAPRK